MSTRRLLFLSLIVNLGFQASLQAQAHATPELKQQEEAVPAAKLQKARQSQEAAQGEFPEQSLKAKPAEKPGPVTYAAPVEVTQPDLYKLVAIDAVDLNNKHTPQEMEAFQAEAEGAFAHMNIVLDWESGSWYFIPRDNQEKPFEKKFQVEEGLLQFVGCQDCQGNMFTIAKQTDDALILHAQPQDEGDLYIYVLTFKK